MRAENAGLPNLMHYEIHLINAQNGYAYNKVKVKAFIYSIPSVGPGADPSVQAVSPQVTVSHPPGGRLPLLSASRRSPLPIGRCRGPKFPAC